MPAFQRGSRRRSVSTGAQLPSVPSGFHSPATASAGGARCFPPIATKRCTIGSSTKPSPRLLHSSSGKVEHAKTYPLPTRRPVRNGWPSAYAPYTCAVAVAVRGIWRWITESRASGSETPASVRCSGPSRSSQAVTRNASFPLFSISPHEIPATPALSPWFFPGGSTSSTPPSFTN